MLRQAADATGLKVVSEVIAEDQMDTAAKYCDMFQIGARNMQNFRLLKAVGRSGVPVLLKRGIASTIEEWLDAAEYIMSEGNYNVVLCERGIRTFETATRHTLDISAVPVIKERSCLPIIVDPPMRRERALIYSPCPWLPPPAAPTASSSRFTLALSALCPTPSSS